MNKKERKKEKFLEEPEEFQTSPSQIIITRSIIVYQIENSYFIFIVVGAAEV